MGEDGITATGPRRRKWKRWALIGGVLLVLLTAAPFVAWGPALAFDGQVWHRTGLSGVGWPPPWDNARARMVDDLVANHVRLGMPKAEVEELLGSPAEAHGGGGSSTGGVWSDYMYFHLLSMPRPDQEIVAWLKWGSTDPRLVVHLEDHRVVGVTVGSR